MSASTPVRSRIPCFQTRLQSIFGCAFLLLLTFTSTPARAQTLWTGAIDNDWFKAGNWSLGTPVAGTAGQINNGGTALISSGNAFSSQFILGDPSGSSGTVTLAGATTTWTNTGDLTVGNSGIGTLTLGNGGTVSVASSFIMAVVSGSTGTLNLNTGGLFQVGGANGLRAGAGTAAFNFAGGTLKVTSNLTSAVNATLSGTTSTIDTNGFTASFSGIFSGGGATAALTKTGAGTLTFSGSLANSFAGTTTVTGGTLVLAKSGNAPSIVGDLVIGNSTSPGALLSVVARLSTTSQTTSSTDVTIFTDGWLDLNLGAFATINIGSLTMTGGKVSIYDRILTLSSDVTVNASAGGSVINSTDSFNNLTFGNGTRTFTIADGSATYDLNVQAGVGFGTLVKAGPGVMRMAGATNNSLSVKLDAGTLALASNTALGNGTFTLAGGTVVADSGNRTIANAISLTGDAAIGASVDGSPRAISFTGTMTLSGNRAVTVNNSALTTFATVSLGSNALTLDGTGAVTITGVLSGTGGSLVKNGASRLKLTGANLYTGGSTVNFGVLEVNNTLGSATGTGAVLMKTGSTLTGSGVIQGVVTMEDGAILAPGNSPGILTVGKLILNAGTRLQFELGLPQSPGPGIAGTDSDLVNVNVNVNGSGSTGDLHLAGILDLTANAGFGTGIYRLFNYGGTLTGTGATMPFGSAPAGYNLVVTSSGGQVNLIVNYDGLQFWDGGNSTPGFVANGRGGNGTWNATNTNWTNQTGNANNDWSNLTAVFAGTAGIVQVATPGLQIEGLHFKTDGYTLAAGGGSLDVGTSGAELRIDPTLTATISAPLIGTGGITKTGNGIIILTGTNTYEGGTALNAGTLSISADANLGTAPTSAVADHLEFNGGTLQATASFTLNANRGITLTSDGTLEVTGTESLVYGGIITGPGALEKSGTGSLQLLGAGDYSGGTTISGGSLLLGNGLTMGAALGSGDVTIDTAGTLTLQLADAETFANGVTNEGHFIADGASGVDYIISSAISGAGDFEKKGANTVTLTGTNDYSGGTTISGGALRLGNGSTTGSITGNVLNNASLVFNRSDDLAFDGVISGNGTVIKQNTNALTFTAANSYAGGTTINSGRMVTTHTSALGTGPVTLNAGGILAPTGVLHIDSLMWNDGEIALNPLNGDLLEITGAFTDGGNGGTFILGALNLGMNTLATFGSTDFTVPIFISANPDVDYGVYAFFVNGTSLQLNMVSATAKGALLQNSGPVFIPTFADFTVDGPVKTGSPAESNTIKSLIFLPGSSLQVFNNLVVTSGNFTVNGGRAVINGGHVIVPGDFNKNGGGALVLNTFLQASGNANINQGALFVNGTLAADRINVFHGALLGGSGVLFGDVFNSGTVAPGNSPGTLSIIGIYTQRSIGTLQIEIASEKVFDRLVVSGTARLDGTLDIRNYHGNTLSYGQQVPFLRAGKIVGTFDEILMPEADRFRGRFLNAGNTGILLVAPTSYTLVAETPNQTRVAQALDRWIGIEDGDIGGVTLALDLLTAEQYPVAFEAIMPGYYAAALSTGIELSQNQGQMLFQQLSSRRLGARTPQPAPAAPVSAKGAKNVAPVQPQVAIAQETQWNGWMQGSGLFSDGGLSLNPGENFDSGTFMVGADFAVGENVSLGVFASYQEGWGDYDNGGDMDLESVRFGGYATYDLGGFYASGAVGGGTTDYSVKRPIQWATLDRSARSDPDGTEFFTLLGTGYDFHAGNFTFGPSLSAQYTKLRLDEFTEAGADTLDLRVRDAEEESLRTYLGGRIAYTIKVNDRFTVIPELRAFWEHEFLQGGENLNASLNGGSGPAFSYVTEEPGKDAVYVGAGLNFKFGDSFTTSVYYHANFGRNDDAQHAVSVSANWKF